MTADILAAKERNTDLLDRILIYLDETKAFITMPEDRSLEQVLLAEASAELSRLEEGNLVKAFNGTLDALAEARRQVEERDEALRGVLPWAELGFYLWDACSFTAGDGRSEPHERSIEWQWQQARPDEYGWDAMRSDVEKFLADLTEDTEATPWVLELPVIAARALLANPTEQPEPASSHTWAEPKPGDERVINGKLSRFVELDDKGEVWEILGPAPEPAGGAKARLAPDFDSAAHLLAGAVAKQRQHNAIAAFLVSRCGVALEAAGDLARQMLDATALAPPANGGEA